MKKYLFANYWLFLAALLPGADAATLTVIYEGTVQEVDPSSNASDSYLSALQDAGIVVGSPMMISATYDLTTPDSNAASYIGEYFEPFLWGTISIGGFTTSFRFDGNDAIIVRPDAHYIDYFAFLDFDRPEFPEIRGILSFVHLEILGGLLLDDSLPIRPLGVDEIAGYNSGNGSFMYIDLSSMNYQYGAGVMGEISHIRTVVPVPPSLLLFAGALVCFRFIPSRPQAPRQ